MGNLLLAAKVVFPLFIYMAAGGLAKRLGILGEDTLRQVNGMIFKIFIPLALFFDVYDSDLKSIFSPRLFLSAALLAIFAAPTAVASAPMAQSMGGNGTLAGEIVALTSAASILTVFLFVFALSGLGLL